MSMTKPKWVWTKAEQAQMNPSEHQWAQAKPNKHNQVARTSTTEQEPAQPSGYKQAGTKGDQQKNRDKHKLVAVSTNGDQPKQHNQVQINK